ncbi:hypothetical protein GE115_06240 [Agromyces sp. CFH 90414]|uniref:Lipoprotein n=1 Tax=Agromyces agglutinans TaxID=2662258 RepID=A0A6I2F4E1_9MICO|nr:hypothetical protein [Agromyces agglutinans]MRG59472.1 hypothetical protein [Agromyces agglutinans]
MTATRQIAAASLAALALLLGGCTAGGDAQADKTSSTTTEAKPSETPDASESSSAGGQTVQEACEGIQTSLAEVAQLSSVDTSDPAAALEALKGASASVTEAAAAVENPEVKAAADGVAGSLEAYVVYLGGVVVDPANADLSAMGDQVAGLQTSITELGTICSA